MSVFGYGVYVTGLDPDAPESLEYAGVRKTLRGAQTLAEKHIGRIWGFRSVDGDRVLTAETESGKARFVRDYFAPR